MTANWQWSEEEQRFVSRQPAEPAATETEAAPASARQLRYEELLRQGLSSADALEQEAYEYRTRRDNGLT